MKQAWLVLMLCIFMYSKDESFITTEEYGQELYKNPRGIGCIQCHGKKGEGKIIAIYKEKGKQKVLRGPDITKLDFQTFKIKTLQDKSVMPKYHLTGEEIEAIYLFLKQSTTP
ncbi:MULTISPECIES: c-type cytochrome [unclassified Helicobacter]|uniref:c-type cytochrome n=1 Tax=unclassified Helicobacter TaxID=2593540 RepID=UPI001315ADEE|nr:MULTISPECIES: cytochrome c [unclassified Helicobacter]